MKIAIASQDGREVSGHLGHCPRFLVYKVEEGKIQHSETRSLEGNGCQCQHGTLFNLLGDCQCIISGGMGQGLFAMLQERGIEPVMTDETLAEVALTKYLAGTLSRHAGHSCNCHH